MVANDWDPRAGRQEWLQGVHVRIPFTVIFHAEIVRVIAHVSEDIDVATLTVLEQIGHVVVL